MSTRPEEFENINDLNASEGRFTEFQNLMRRRVREVLLVSNLYDSFILAQDGQLGKLILNEFVDLNLYQAPDITRVSGARAALDLMEREPRFDLVITTMRVGEMDVLKFARELKERGGDVPLVLLTYETDELRELQRTGITSAFDKVFLWQGDFRILLAIVKFIEDRWNVEHDTRAMGVQISVPPTTVLSTDTFDRFIESNRLLDFAMSTEDERDIVRRFIAADFPDEYLAELKELIELVRYPLAVRSSSLLEDSQYIPFAGVYATYMLANNHPDPEVRLRELLTAVKRIYASCYCDRAKRYIKATHYRLEEEKMAVIIQRLVGGRHENRFYPDISGLARSYNYYPKPPMKPTDGMVSVALGLGDMVMKGGDSVRFCPKYPRHALQFTNVTDLLDHSQRDFYALDLDDPPDIFRTDREPDLKRFSLEVAERDGTLHKVASVYSPENDAVYDGLSRAGIKLVSLAPILKHNIFPLPEIIGLLLEFGKQGMGGPVEIEFAVDLSKPREAGQDFAILQIRPMVLVREFESLEFDDAPREAVLCRTGDVLGVGIWDDIHDVVYVDVARFNRAHSRDVARDVARLNKDLTDRQRSYILIGVGRWGSADPWLGIPVTWDQVTGARVIIEAGFKDFKVVPSQGAHFFHNLITFQVGYFTVNPDLGEGEIDWNWLSRQPAVQERGCVRHLHFERPLVVKMNSFKSRGVILKPQQ